MKQSGRQHRGGTSAGASTPFIISGWELLRWPEFETRWNELVKEVERLKQNDPIGYKQAEVTRFLAAVVKIVRDDVPSDPGHARYRQGRTLGAAYAHWRRAKFGGSRFRLFFRYSSHAKKIIYVWLNDENTLRKAGAKSDAYAVFRAMLESARPPTDWDALERACKSWNAESPGAEEMQPDQAE